MVTDEHIYLYLLGPFVVNAMYNAPPELRPNDNNPSFGVYDKGDGVLKWYDFGLANRDNKAINLLMEMRGVNFAGALRIVKTEIAPATLGKPKVKLKRNNFKGQLPFIKWREHNKLELEYWAKFHQTPEDLYSNNIYALDSLQYKGNDVKITSMPNDPAFVYLYNASPLSCKIYRPYNDKFHHRMYNTTGVIEGWVQLQTRFKNRGKPFSNLFILSSTKDRVSWNKVIEEDEATINPRGEGILREIIEKKDEINLLAYNVFVIFDGDNTGELRSKELAETCNWKAISTTGTLGWDEEKERLTKDLARHLELNNIEKLRQWKSEHISGGNLQS